MSFPEKETWARVRPVLAAAKLDPHRVENRVGPGMPDVNYKDGWIELKYVKRADSRDDIVKVRHFRPAQRVWLRRRWLAGGNAFLLLDIGHEEFLLFDGFTAARDVGTSPLSVLRQNAINGYVRFNSDFVKFLCRN